jgi:DNA repair exonuclease SbcCD ATPase subunit
VADDTQRFQTYDQRTGRLERQSIVVDEEFDVTVDGQALDTLSGSGKAVANLALRLGLGQVLINRVFSLFIGDEIDASLDVDRASRRQALSIR